MSGLLKTATGSDKRANEKAKRTKTSPADVISWSGCKDSQTSADAVEAGTATGAMSFAFISALNQGGEQSYQSLLITIRGILKAKYSQKPQLSSSHPMVRVFAPAPSALSDILSGHELDVHDVNGSWIDILVCKRSVLPCTFGHCKIMYWGSLPPEVDYDLGFLCVVFSCTPFMHILRL